MYVLRSKTYINVHFKVKETYNYVLFEVKNVRFVSFANFVETILTQFVRIFRKYGIFCVSNFAKIQNSECSAFRRALNFSNIQAFSML